MLPLTGRRILITRSRHQASELATRLEAVGATTILIPTIEMVPPESFAALDGAITHLNDFDWLVFTSVNAVEAFRKRAANHVSHALAHVRTAAIGPATANAARQMGLNVAIIPPIAVAESLATTLLPQISGESRILLVRASVARNDLPEALTGAGADVTIAEAYRTRIPEASLSVLRQIFSDSSQHPHAITFTSSSTVTNLISLLEAADLMLPPSVTRASIGPITTQTLCAHSLPPHLQAPNASTVSLADSLAEYMMAHHPLNTTLLPGACYGP